MRKVQHERFWRKTQGRGARNRRKSTISKSKMKVMVVQNTDFILKTWLWLSWDCFKNYQRTGQNGCKRMRRSRSASTSWLSHIGMYVCATIGTLSAAAFW